MILIIFLGYHLRTHPFGDRVEGGPLYHKGCNVLDVVTVFGIGLLLLL
ncbi:hypothetical protein HY967_03335 [Candidatus Jorgensenbacteria bacterium]|nr:hypothetical protein [Candidatus Jorgensenbacteria bacterium]